MKNLNAKVIVSLLAAVLVLALPRIGSADDDERTDRCGKGGPSFRSACSAVRSQFNSANATMNEFKKRDKHSGLRKNLFCCRGRASCWK